MTLRDLLIDYPQEKFTSVAVTRFEAAQSEYESPMHRHKTGQIVLTLTGNVTCRTEKGIWLVPPQCAIWLPPGTFHCNRISPHSGVCMLFVETEEIRLPETTCTLSVTPLVTELVPAYRFPGRKPKRLPAMPVCCIRFSLKNCRPCRSRDSPFPFPAIHT